MALVVIPNVASVIPANSVTNAMLAQADADSILGNNAGAPANVAYLTAAQVKTLLAIAAADVSGLGPLATIANAGTTAGRANVPVLIYSAALAAANAATWTAGAYKTLKFFVSYSSATSVTSLLTLTGLTGTYGRQVFFSSAGAVTFANAANWDIGLGGGSSFFVGEFYIAAGGPRYGASSAFSANVTQAISGVYFNGDTTNAVTGFSLPISPSPASGHIEVWGVPS